MEMSVSAIHMPWLAVNARPQPDKPAAPVSDQNPVVAVQPLPDNPAQHIQRQRDGRNPNEARPATQSGPPKPMMPDLHFPDPLPDLPKIDAPTPKAGYPAALGILGGSAKGKLG
jgi:hypothetical protein